jgi:hypothetical protein
LTSYPKFGSIPRWYKTFTISEKVDGTNGLIAVLPEGEDYYNLRREGTEPVAIADGFGIFAGSRSRWLSADDKAKDNAGFARWISEHAPEVAQLGEGFHYGEWYGSGINRGYGLPKGEKRFALFNTYRWTDTRPDLFDVVPVLWQGSGDDLQQGIDSAIQILATNGSVISPGFRNPEGIVIYSNEAKTYWKKTLQNDRIPKDMVK